MEELDWRNKQLWEMNVVVWGMNAVEHLEAENDCRFKGGPVAAASVIPTKSRKVGLCGCCSALHSYSGVETLSHLSEIQNFEIPNLPSGRDKMGGALQEDDLLGPVEPTATGEMQWKWVAGNGSN
ncbi:hypothetical protein DVH24_007864 [Malus domestica]|uniref:Uncharacterized protein n=1 Tax=Malus domestica TaxID=3750 RepID=A0A498JP50_MALDO|nr:hypothetical protein DVH24_007864 [Malus domestica]